MFEPEEQRAEQLRYSEMLQDLQKCGQITYDDRLMLRDKIKSKNVELKGYFDGFKRDKQLSQLQVKLRRYLQDGKGRKNISGKSQVRRYKQVGSRQFPQKSLPSSSKVSLQSSVQKMQRGSKHKIIKIDISEFRRSLEKEKDNLTLKSTSPRLKLGGYMSPQAREIRHGKEMGRKISAATLKDNQEKLLIEERHTLTDFNTFSPSDQHLHNPSKIPKPSFIGQICATEEVEQLMRSKLKKGRKCCHIKQQAKGVELKGLNLFKDLIQSNKENTDFFNRENQSKCPATETDRYAHPQDRQRQKCRSRGKTDRESEDPIFGQFHNIIKNILRRDAY